MNQENQIAVIISWDSFIQLHPEEIKMALESHFKTTGFHVRPAVFGDLIPKCNCGKCTGVDIEAMYRDEE